MDRSTNYIDCCPSPVLETVRRFSSTQTDFVAIRRCQGCGAFWFYFLREELCELNVIPDDSEGCAYDRHIWYVRLAPDEANTLLGAETVPEPGLFADRPGFLKGFEGMHPIIGIPEFVR